MGIIVPVREMKLRLKELRLKKGMRQWELAEALHFSRSAYNLYETGRRQPSYEGLCSIADYFGVNMDYILGRTEIDAPIPSFSREEIELIEKYRRLDVRGRATVRGLTEFEARLRELEAREEQGKKT